AAFGHGGPALRIGVGLPALAPGAEQLVPAEPPSLLLPTSRERPDATAAGPGGSPGLPGCLLRGVVSPPARRAGDAPGRGAVGLSDRRAGHPRERFHQAGAGTMTMGTMGCSGAAGGAPRSGEARRTCGRLHPR